MSKLDFDRPTGIYMFCLYEGNHIVFGERDDWIEELGILLAEEIIDELREKFEEEIEEKYQEKMKRKQEEKEARMQ